MEEFIAMDTGIQSLNEVLRGGPIKAAKSGIIYHRQTGLFGVIFGTAGSGKSILCLQLCKGFLLAKSTRSSSERNKPRHVVYFTQEHPDAIKAKFLEHFDFAAKGGIEVVLEDEIPRIWQACRKASKAKNGSKPSLTIVRLPLDKQAQRDKLGFVFHLLNEGFCKPVGHKADPKERLLVCVDNAETITPESYEKAFDVPITAQGEPFYKSLREYCARHRLNTWFAFEEARPQQTIAEDAQIATTPQAYAADIVVRLGISVIGNGYRERSLEIIKAKNQPYRRGRHHFSIRNINQAKTDRSEPGIVIYPSLASQLQALGREKSSSAVAHVGGLCSLGIEEIDRAVHRPETTKFSGAGYLLPGSISVLVSDIDSSASEIALHFLLQEEKKRTLYLTTQHRVEVLELMTERYGSLASKLSKGGAKGTGAEVLQLAPEHISDSKLLHDIKGWIYAGERKAKRVVFDNVSALSAKFPLLRNESHFITALFALFRSEGVTAFVVDMVEVGEGRNPIEKSFAAGLADNVFTLRHVEFQSQQRKVFSVLELAGLAEPKNLWEIESHPDRIHARDLLDDFKGVLAGRLEPVEISLTLYGDAPDSPRHRYLKTQCEMLKETFGQKIALHDCHPDAYVNLQQSVTASDLRAIGDCHIISIDEIWLEDLIGREVLDDIPRDYFPNGKDGEWDWQSYITTAHDLALRHKRLEDPEDFDRKHPRLPGDRPNFAIPDRNNVGVLAYNPNIWHSEWRGGSGSVKLHSGLWKKMSPFQQMQEPGARSNGISWARLVELQSGFLQEMDSFLGWSGKAIEPSLYREWEEESDRKGRLEFSSSRDLKLPEWGVFTFCMENRESCVSFFLELVLSVLPKGAKILSTHDNLAKDGILQWEQRAASLRLGFDDPHRDTIWVRALGLLLHLLSPWDLMRLSHSWFRPSNCERPCLFSRQWFSNCGIVGTDYPGLRIMELPEGAAGDPTPISGAWYLGMLKGSTARRAGARLIGHLTSPREELYKLNRGIGMPVRRTLYEAGEQPVEARTTLPYQKLFSEVAKAQKGWLKSKKYPARVLNSHSPFYRSRIQRYSEVSPLLMGMMVAAARVAVRYKWQWQRNHASWKKIHGELGTICKKAQARYRKIV